MQATLLLADDNSTTRSALRLVLEKRLEVRVRGEAASLQELNLLAGQLQPDLLILAWELPGFSGASGLLELRRIAPRMKVVALSARPEAGPLPWRPGWMPLYRWSSSPRPFSKPSENAASLPVSGRKSTKALKAAWGEELQMWVFSTV